MLLSSVVSLYYLWEQTVNLDINAYLTTYYYHTFDSEFKTLLNVMALSPLSESFA